MTIAYVVLGGAISVTKLRVMMSHICNLSASITQQAHLHWAREWSYTVQAY